MKLPSDPLYDLISSTLSDSLIFIQRSDNLSDSFSGRGRPSEQTKRYLSHRSGQDDSKFLFLAKSYTMLFSSPWHLHTKTHQNQQFNRQN